MTPKKFLLQPIYIIVDLSDEGVFHGLEEVNISLRTSESNLTKVLRLDPNSDRLVYLAFLSLGLQPKFFLEPS